MVKFPLIVFSLRQVIILVYLSPSSNEFFSVSREKHVCMISCGGLRNAVATEEASFKVSCTAVQEKINLTCCLVT